MKSNKEMITILKLDIDNKRKYPITILELPNDMIKVIAGYLSLRDMINFGKSMKQFYKAVFGRELVIRVLQNEQLSTALTLSMNNNVIENQAGDLPSLSALVNNRIADKKPEENYMIIKLASEAIDADEQKNKYENCLSFLINCARLRDGQNSPCFIRKATFLLIIPASVFLMLSISNVFAADGSISVALSCMMVSLILLGITAVAWYPDFQATQLYDARHQWKEKFNGKITSLTNALGLFKDQNQSSTSTVSDIENIATDVRFTPNHDEAADENTRLILPIN